MSSAHVRRSEAEDTNFVMDAIFDGIPAKEKDAYLKFLAGSIQLLRDNYHHRWGVSLFKDRVRLNVGSVEVLVLTRDALQVLLEIRSVPKGVKLTRVRYQRAPGCAMTSIDLHHLSKALGKVAEAHLGAIRIAAKTKSKGSIKGAHSHGVLKYLAQVLPNFSIERPSSRLHMLNGGYGNGDKGYLVRLAETTGRARWWIVPKKAEIGDEVVINVASEGLFAVGQIASTPRPAKDWMNRYSSQLCSIRLIEPPIPLVEVRQKIEDFKWARYPRSITTPDPKVAQKIRGLVRKRVIRRPAQISEAELETATLEELRKVAMSSSSKGLTPEQRRINHRKRSVAIKQYALRRAKGNCEGCGQPSAFLNKDGSPYLEVHHTTRVADGGADHPDKVIGVCPTCHRHAHHGNDAKAFNDELIKKLKEIVRQRSY